MYPERVQRQANMGKGAGVRPSGKGTGVIAQRQGHRVRGTGSRGMGDGVRT